MNKTFKISDRRSAEESYFDRQERISWWSQEVLTDAKIMVVGAGAIGNETLKNLALLGVGNIFIADFDTISKSNLSRTVLFRKSDLGKKKAEIAATRTKELCLNENARVNWFHGDVVWELGIGVFKNMDIILGCLDNVESRFAINRICRLVSKPWIDAGIAALRIRVDVYGPEGSCYECLASDEQIAASRIRYSCDNFKKKLYQEGKVATVQVASSLVAAIQTQEAIKVLNKDYRSIGKKIYYEGKINDFDYLTIPENEDCEAHVQYPEIISTTFQSTIKLGTFLQQISRDHFNNLPVSLDLRGDREFVRSVSCSVCNTMIEMYKPSFRIYAEEVICDNCRKDNQKQMEKLQETPVTKDLVFEFSLENTEQRILEMRLDEIGIPLWHVIAVKNLTNGNYRYFELAGDSTRILS